MVAYFAELGQCLPREGTALNESQFKFELNGILKIKTNI